MLTLYIILPIVFVAYRAYLYYAGLQEHIAAAKASGLPYVIVPLHIFGRTWLITNQLFLPWLQKLPTAWTESWIDYMEPDWVYKKRFESFAKHGDTFMTVCYCKNLLWVATPEIIQQITAQRDAFPKPLESYAILDIYGRSLVTTEGAEWRQHRKISSPSFNEKNNVLVFKESIAQTQSMLRKWTAPGAEKIIRSVPQDAMRVALHIISLIGFGVKLLWPGEKAEEKDKIAGVDFGSAEPPQGHTMSFAHALEALLEKVIFVLICPKWLLRRLPFRPAKIANESHDNWTQFMDELFKQKVDEARSGQRSEGMDLLGGLVKSSYGDSKGSFTLTDSEILGNAFVMIIAGHETTANTIHFALIMLAMTPSSQRRLQMEVNTLFGDSDPETWDYDTQINQLLGGMVGAVLSEVLRVFPPVVSIPKSVRADADQTVTVNGEKRVIGKGTFINLVTMAVHRHPAYWPSKGRSKISGKDNDLDDFVPERWLLEGSTQTSGPLDTPQDSDEDGTDQFGGFTGTTCATGLFHPARGAYIPFSEGARSCIGRRLAQVEVVAVLSVIFQKYSIELDVSQWASDEEVDGLLARERQIGDDGIKAREELRAIYGKAMTRCRWILDHDASTRITLKLHDNPDHVPVRICKKGEERFLGLID